MTELLTPLPVHEIANMLPELSPQEAFQLAESIRKHGQLVPILIYEGKIIDGRSRYNACREIGVEPIVAEWNPPADKDGIIPAVIELNLARRHLTLPQKMAVAANAMEALSANRKALQDKHPVSGRLPEVEEEFFGCSKAFAARTFGLDEKFVDLARKIKIEMPELHSELMTGDIKPEEVARQYQAKKAEAAMPERRPDQKLSKEPVKRLPRLPNPFKAECLVLVPGTRDEMVALSDRLEADNQAHQIAMLVDGKWVTEMCKARG